MKYNRICQILGIEKPVIQGPLSWLTDARLVAAVSNAGGLGLRGLRIGMLEGNTDEGYIALGTGIGNIRSIKSVAEVVNELAIC